LQVRINGRSEWGTVCGGDPRLVCRQLGLLGPALSREGFVGGGGLKMAMRVQQCPDNATRWDQCTAESDPPAEEQERCHAMGVACGGELILRPGPLLHGSVACLAHAVPLAA